jgi:hypothetical protein
MDTTAAAAVAAGPASSLILLAVVLQLAAAVLAPRVARPRPRSRSASHLPDAGSGGVSSSGGGVCSPEEEVPLRGSSMSGGAAGSRWGQDGQVVVLLANMHPTLQLQGLLVCFPLVPPCPSPTLLLGPFKSCCPTPPTTFPCVCPIALVLPAPSQHNALSACAPLSTPVLLRLPVTPHTRGRLRGELSRLGAGFRLIWSSPYLSATCGYLLLTYVRDTAPLGRMRWGAGGRGWCVLTMCGYLLLTYVRHAACLGQMEMGGGGRG